MRTIIHYGSGKAVSKFNTGDQKTVAYFGYKPI